MNGDWQSTMRQTLGILKERLECLSIEHIDKAVQAGIDGRSRNKKYRLLGCKLFEIHFLFHRDHLTKLWTENGVYRCIKCSENTARCFYRKLMEGFPARYGKTARVFLWKELKFSVKGCSNLPTALSEIYPVMQFENISETGIFLGHQNISNLGWEQRSGCLIPIGISSRFVLSWIGFYNRFR